MDKLRLINYRCLEDTGDIELRPITLLLGANSSGKSSFIKFFPLLQQSIGTTVNGLFLWDGQYVDFKDFKNTVRNGKGEITVEYLIDKLIVSSLFRGKDPVLNNVRVTMTLSAKNKYYDYLKCVEIKYENVNISYTFNKEGKVCNITANSVKTKDFDGNDEKEIVEAGFDNNFLPSIRFSYRTKNYTIEGPTSPSAARTIMQFRKEKDINNPIKLFDADAEKNLIVERNKIFTEFRKNDKDASEEILSHITDVRIYQLSGRILNAVNDYFSIVANNISYVMPLRSIMNRYYRFQNRAVDQIDPDGDNIAMFLNSLDEKDINDYNTWLEDIFGFRIKMQNSEGHVEMLINEGNQEDGSYRNLIDVGFGYTQILPILTIIWKSIYDRKSKGNDRNILPITIAIEQPELHLHPKFQADFAKMLAKVMGDCRKKNIMVRIIIETHSEMIVNKIGELIDNKESPLEASDVNIVLFNAAKEGMSKYVHTTSFSSNGFLEEWPYGFFEENVY